LPLILRRLLIALPALCCATASAQPILEQPSLTLDAAVKMVNACESLAKSKGWKVSIWVVDDNGLPIHMKRMEGAPVQAITTAEMKAKSSKLWLGSTDPADPKSPLAKLIKEQRGQAISVLTNAFPEGGGLPVIVGGKFAGAIGVSGADGASDTQCAQAAVDAILKR